MKTTNRTVEGKGEKEIDSGLRPAQALTTETSNPYLLDFSVDLALHSTHVRTVCPFPNRQGSLVCEANENLYLLPQAVRAMPSTRVSDWASTHRSMGLPF